MMIASTRRCPKQPNPTMKRNICVGKRLRISWITRAAVTEAIKPPATNEIANQKVAGCFAWMTQSVVKIINKKPTRAPKAKANVAPEKANAYFRPLEMRTQVVNESSAIVMKGAA